jgi:TonB family protein
VKIRTLAALAACMAAGPLHAQPGSQRIAGFLYVPRADSATARDASWTLLYATPGEGRAEAGSITWGCTANGMMLAVTAPELAAGQPVRMVYRFDEGRPDTVAATTWPQGNAFSLPAARQRAFTLQAIGSRQLAVRLLHAAGESDRRFALEGAMHALGLLPCVRELTGPAIVVAPPTAADSARFGEYLLNAVEVAPRLTNARYVAGVLVQQYPPALRDAGVGGRVMLRVRVRQDGSVDAESIQVVSATHTELVYPARRVAAEMKFAPGRVDGRPVTTIIEIPVHFQVAQ